MDVNAGILDKAANQVRQHFEKNVSTTLYFHDLHHTLQVVDASSLMAAAMQLSEEDRLALLLAAWFHDTGYSSAYEGHEKASMEIARKFCKEEGLVETVIAKMSSCVLATSMPQSPVSTIEQIICDADMAHLGSANYPEESKLLRKEINTVFNKDISKKAWRRTNIRFLQEHRYFTEYARTHFEPVKQAHLKALLDKEVASKGETVETPVGTIEDVPASEAIATEKEKKPADKAAQSRTWLAALSRMPAFTSMWLIIKLN